MVAAQHSEKASNRLFLYFEKFKGVIAINNGKIKMANCLVQLLNPWSLLLV